MKNRGNDLFSNQIPKLLITSENKILLVLKLEKKPFYMHFTEQQNCWEALCYYNFFILALYT